MQFPIALGMVQPEALPGSFKHSGTPLPIIIDRAVREAQSIAEHGFHGFILQNMNDMPIKQHSSPEAIACMSVIGLELRRRFPNLLMGILMNWDGVASLAVADAVGADFVRVEHLFIGAEVTSAGLLEGQCCEIAAMRKKLGTKIPVYADVYEVHGVPLGAKPIADACWDAVHEAFADGLFLSGKTSKESLEMIAQVRKRLPDVPVFLGGGATAENIYELLQHFDGVSVATWIKDGDMRNPVNPQKAGMFMEQVALAREKRRKGK